MNEKFWKTEWIIFGLISIFLISLLFFNNSSHSDFTFTFAAVIFSLIVIFFKAYDNETIRAREFDVLMKTEIQISKSKNNLKIFKQDLLLEKLQMEIEKEYSLVFNMKMEEIFSTKIKEIGPAIYRKSSSDVLELIKNKLLIEFERKFSNDEFILKYISKIEDPKLLYEETNKTIKKIIEFIAYYYMLEQLENKKKYQKTLTKRKDKYVD